MGLPVTERTAYEARLTGERASAQRLANAVRKLAALGRHAAEQILSLIHDHYSAPVALASAMVAEALVHAADHADEAAKAWAEHALEQPLPAPTADEVRAWARRLHAVPHDVSCPEMPCVRCRAAKALADLFNGA